MNIYWLKANNKQATNTKTFVQKVMNVSLLKAKNTVFDPRVWQDSFQKCWWQHASVSNHFTAQSLRGCYNSINSSIPKCSKKHSHRRLTDQGRHTVK